MVVSHLALLPLPAGTIAVAAQTIGVVTWGLLTLPGRLGLKRPPRALSGALLGAALVSTRLALGGLPLPSYGASGTVVDDAAVMGRVESLLAPLRGSQRFIAEIGDAHLSVEAPPNPRVLVGDTVRIVPQGRQISAEAAERQRLRGITGNAVTRSLTVVRRGGLVEQIRARVGDDIERVVPAPAGGLAAAITVGLRERVDERLADAFTATGLGHVVALSGWNVAIVMSVVDRLLRRLPTRRRRPLLIAAALVFGVFAGASASVIRASFMAAATLVAAAGGRRGSGAAALAHAVTSLLLINPAICADAGFRLSALATAGLLAKGTAWSVAAERLERHLPERTRPAWRLVCGDIAVSLAAQAATLGVVVALFGRIALWSIPLTLAIAPLIAPATGAAVLAAIGGEAAAVHHPLLDLVAWLLGLPATALFRAAAWIATAGATLPAGGLAVSREHAAVVGGAIALLGAWLLLRRSRLPATDPEERQAGARQAAPRLLALALGVIFVASSAASARAANPRNALRIAILDVGQGDAVLVEIGARRMLIDGGPNPSRLAAELDRLVPPWDRRIDLLVASHPHEDHLAGLPPLLDRYRIGTVVSAEDRGGGPASTVWQALLSSSGKRHRVVHAGDAILLDAARLTVLWPDRDALATAPSDDGRALNNRSIVMLLEVPGFSALLTGDIEEGLDRLIAARLKAPVDFLKAPHHGSATSSSETLVSAAAARFSAVSAGKGNPYGHPSRGTLFRLAALGGAVDRTDTGGTIVVSFDLVTARMRVTDDTGAIEIPERRELGVRWSFGPRGPLGRAVLRAADAARQARAGCPIPSATIRP